MPLSPADLASDAARTIALQMLQERGRGTAETDQAYMSGVREPLDQQR